MRVVLDTSVLLRAIIRPRGLSQPILSGLRHGDYTLLYSQALLDELVDVLNRPRICLKYGLSGADIATVIRLILLRRELVAPARIAASRDPQDDKFLAVAVGGKADVIVSKDGDLLALDPFDTIPVVSSGVFLQMLRKSG